MKETKGQADARAVNELVRAKLGVPVRAEALARCDVRPIGGHGITVDELRLAARNHAMPLEALRWPITPVGLHYLLVHYDVPLVDPAGWRLEIGGAVERPLRARARRPPRAPGRRHHGDDGVRRQRSRAARAAPAQPAVAHRRPSGRRAGAACRSATLLEEAAPTPAAVDVVFAGLDRGVEGGVEQRYERSLPLGEALEAGAVSRTR